MPGSNKMLSLSLSPSLSLFCAALCPCCSPSCLFVIAQQREDKMG